MTFFSRLGVALAAGAVAGLATFGVSTGPVRLMPGERLWTRCVGGAGADGTLGASTTVFVPSVDRTRPAQLVIETESPGASLGVAADRGELRWLRLGREPALVSLEATDVPGVHLTLRADPPGGVRLRALNVRTEGHPWPRALGLGLMVALFTTRLLGRAPQRLALALSMLASALAVFAVSPLLLWWTLPAPGAIARVVAPMGLLLAALVIGLTPPIRHDFGWGALLVGAAVFGVAVRLYFLPSAGSWDVDYWKACALQTSAHGVSHAYGGPDATPRGHFLAQMHGDEPAWELPAFGRQFVIDQPPGIQWLWQSSWRVMSRLPLAVSRDEALNVAAKLPPILGDLGAVGVLLWAFARRPRQAAVLAALYWALPISWLPGAVLGFFDGTYVPLVLAALVLAGRGHSGRAGACLAAAALVKSLALLMAPAVAVALWTVRAPLRRAVFAGLAVVMVALLPFVVDGTLPTAVVHMYRILFQLRLSGGYANAWWLLGHWLSLGPRTATDAVPFVHIETLAFPVRPLGTALFFLVAIWVGRCQARVTGSRAAALAAATLVLAYGQLAIGIHENHPHAFAPALIATGLMSRRLRVIAAIFFSTYVLNMLSLSGLGRFYGLRYVALDAVARAASGLRLGLGFDLTLLLAVMNIATFVWLLAVLPWEMEAASGGENAQAGEP
jgi:hypothetical protein